MTKIDIRWQPALTSLQLLIGMSFVLFLFPFHSVLLFHFTQHRLPFNKDDQEEILKRNNESNVLTP